MSHATIDYGTYLTLLTGYMADYLAKGHDLRSARALAKAEMDGAFRCEDFAQDAADDKEGLCS